VIFSGQLHRIVARLMHCARDRAITPNTNRLNESPGSGGCPSGQSPRRSGRSFIRERVSARNSLNSGSLRLERPIGGPLSCVRAQLGFCNAQTVQRQIGGLTRVTAVCILTKHLPAVVVGRFIWEIPASIGVWRCDDHLCWPYRAASGE
jgi:hypothetical protein